MKIRIQQMHSMDNQEFRELIIGFYEKNGREFPWRVTDNDFHALSAEIMLQQTTAGQVLPIYEEFIEKYSCPEDAVDGEIQIFEELGLFGRAEYIKEIARFLVSEKEINRDNLLEIKGVGNYTANAFLSIHKGKNLPIVDANVERVFRNFFEIEDNRNPRRNEELWRLAEELLPKENVREYNLGLLDYGNYLREDKT